jgi:hypothetical protein
VQVSKELVINIIYKYFLLRTGGISCYDESKVCKIILSSIILHNFCVKNKIPLSAEDEEFRDNFLIQAEYEDHPYDNFSTRLFSLLANNTRDRIANSILV